MRATVLGLLTVFALFVGAVRWVWHHFDAVPNTAIHAGVFAHFTLESPLFWMAVAILFFSVRSLAARYKRGARLVTQAITSLAIGFVCRIAAFLAIGLDRHTLIVTIYSAWWYDTLLVLAFVGGASVYALYLWRTHEYWSTRPRAGA